MSGARRSRMVIADERRLLVDTLVNLLDPEFDVVGTATDGEDLLETCIRLKPDIALIDVSLPRLTGLDAARRMAAWPDGPKLILLAADADEVIAAEAVEAGAVGYLLQTCPAAELLRAIRMVGDGGHYLTPEIAGGSLLALREAGRNHPTPRLSPRELEVLKLLVHGLCMKSVARRLGITARTVAFHKYRAMSILGLRDNPQLIEFAIRHGLLSRDPNISNGPCHARQLSGPQSHSAAN